MAVPKGPGQAETIPGQELNVPGLYLHEQSGVRTHVTHPAAADALVHRGWTLLREGQTLLDDNGEELSPEALKALLRQKGPLPQASAPAKDEKKG